MIVNVLMTLVVALSVVPSFASALGDEAHSLRTKRGRHYASEEGATEASLKKPRPLYYDQAVSLLHADPASRRLAQTHLMTLAKDGADRLQPTAIHTLFVESRDNDLDYLQFRVVSLSIVENPEQPTASRKQCVRLLTRSFVAEDRELGWSLYDRFFSGDVLQD